MMSKLRRILEDERTEYSDNCSSCSSDTSCSKEGLEAGYTSSIEFEDLLSRKAAVNKFNLMFGNE